MATAREIRVKQVYLVPTGQEHQLHCKLEDNGPCKDLFKYGEEVQFMRNGEVLYNL